MDESLFAVGVFGVSIIVIVARYIGIAVVVIVVGGISGIGAMLGVE